MLAGGVSIRYAQALYELAAEKNCFADTEKDLLQIKEVYGASDDFARILNHPRINADAKKAFLSSLFSGKLSAITENFLYFIIDKNREMYLADIIDEYIRLADKARNIAKATVYSAFELDQASLQKINDRLNQIMKKDVVVDSEVQPDLLGGLVIRIGDTVYDASVKNNLNRLRNQLKQI